MKSSGSPCFLIFPGVEVRLRADENIQQHICKVSAKGSHRREPIYRKAITGSKRYTPILLTACNGFPSGEARKWRRQGSHADRREACLPYGTQREGGMKSGCNVCRSRAEEHVTDQPRKWRLHISPGERAGERVQYVSLRILQAYILQPGGRNGTRPERRNMDFFIE